MKKTAVYRWVKHFSEGRESVTDEERSGRPATSRTEEPCIKCTIVYSITIYFYNVISNSFARL
jgi:hypothetical protein